jgi:antitoxin MazE
VTTRKLVSVNGNVALLLDSGVLQILDIEEGSVMRLSTDGDCLVLTPVRAKGRRLRYEKALEAVTAEYDSALKEMAE